MMGHQQPLVIRSTQSSTNLASQAQLGGSRKAWIKKIKQWRSKDDLWGCPGDDATAKDPALDEDEREEEQDTFKEDDDLGMAITSDERQLNRGRVSYSSGTSSVRSSVASQVSSSLSGGGRSRSASTTVSTPSAGSVTSLGSASRADARAKEQQEALEAMESYMDRSHPPSPTSGRFPQHTIRATPRKASLAYARLPAAVSSEPSTRSRVSSSSTAGGTVGPRSPTHSISSNSSSDARPSLIFRPTIVGKPRPRAQSVAALDARTLRRSGLDGPLPPVPPSPPSVRSYDFI